MMEENKEIDVPAAIINEFQVNIIIIWSNK